MHMRASAHTEPARPVRPARDHVRWWRAGAVALLVAVALLGSGLALAWAATAPVHAVRRSGQPSVDELVSLVAAVACAVLLTWLSAAAFLTFCCAVTGRLEGRTGRFVAGITPHLVRRAVGVAVGVSLVGLPVLPGAVASTASTPAPRPASAVAAPDRRVLPEGWSPDRPAATGGPGRPARHPLRDPAPVVLVHRGDTLWDIADRRLGVGSSAADIALEWPRWYAANRSTVGPDPDLLLPGQRLRVPRFATVRLPGREGSR